MATPERRQYGMMRFTRRLGQRQDPRADQDLSPVGECDVLLHLCGLLITVILSEGWVGPRGAKDLRADRGSAPGFVRRSFAPTPAPTLSLRMTQILSRRFLHILNGGIGCGYPRWLHSSGVIAFTRMAVGSRAVLSAVALLIVAPIGAAVLISALLLLGVQPHWVFLPGFVVKSRLEAFGFHVANRVAVLSTVVFWWAIIVSIWLAVRRLWRN